jgi:hypothetical protein
VYLAALPLGLEQLRLDASAAAEPEHDISDELRMVNLAYSYTL